MKATLHLILFLWSVASFLYALIKRDAPRIAGFVILACNLSMLLVDFIVSVEIPFITDIRTIYYFCEKVIHAIS